MTTIKKFSDLKATKAIKGTWNVTPIIRTVEDIYPMTATYDVGTGILTSPDMSSSVNVADGAVVTFNTTALFDNTFVKFLSMQPGAGYSGAITCAGFTNASLSASEVRQAIESLFLGNVGGLPIGFTYMTLIYASPEPNTIAVTSSYVNDLASLAGVESIVGTWTTYQSSQLTALFSRQTVSSLDTGVVAGLTSSNDNLTISNVSGPAAIVPGTNNVPATLFDNLILRPFYANMSINFGGGHVVGPFSALFEPGASLSPVTVPGDSRWVARGNDQTLFDQAFPAPYQGLSQGLSSITSPVFPSGTKEGDFFRIEGSGSPYGTFVTTDDIVIVNDVSVGNESFTRIPAEITAEDVSFDSILPDLGNTTVNTALNYATVGSVSSSRVVYEGDPNNYPQNVVRVVKKQANNKILLGGNFSTFAVQDEPDLTVPVLIRLNTDLTLDTTFNAPSNLSDSVETIAIQADGKILVGGTFTNVGSGTHYIIRLNDDGTEDTTFNIGGTGFNDYVKSIVVQPDGAILVGGTFTQYNGLDCPDKLVRLLSDGTLDASFNSGGTGFHWSTPGNGAVNSILYRQIDEFTAEIYVGGIFSFYNGSACSGGLVRLSTSGTLDSSFNSGGTGFVDTNVYAIHYSNGESLLYVGGDFSTYNGSNCPGGIIRLNPDGTVTVGGFTQTGTNGVVYCIEPEGNSSYNFFIGGSFTTFDGITNNQICFVAPYADNYHYKFDTPYTYGIVYSICFSRLAPDSDGLNRYDRIYVGSSNAPHFSSLRRSGSRSLEVDYKHIIDAHIFPPEGDDKSTYNSKHYSHLASRIALTTPGGSVESVQSFYESIFIDGSSALSVETANRGLTSDSFIASIQDAIDALSRQNTIGASLGRGNSVGSTYKFRQMNDGCVIASTATGGLVTFKDRTVRSLFKLTKEGAIDLTFIPDFEEAIRDIAVDGDNVWVCSPSTVRKINARTGTTEILVNNPGSIHALAVQTDGKVLLGGTFSGGSIKRLNPDGTVDNTFSGGISFGSATVYSIKVQPDGKILVGGHSITTYNSINCPDNLIRLNQDGTIDTSFNSGGSGFVDGSIFVIEVQPDGKILVGGGFNFYNGSECPDHLVRLNTTGTIDSTFNSTGTGFNSMVNSISLLSSGEILVGGTFNEYNNVSTNSFVVLNSSGVRVTNALTSNIGTGYNGFVNHIVVQPDDKIFVGGDFNAYNGAPVPNLMRLDHNYQIDSTFVYHKDVLEEAHDSGAITYLQEETKTTRDFVKTVEDALDVLFDQTQIQPFNEGGEGVSNTTIPVRALALDTTFKVLVGGNFSTFNNENTSAHLLRLNHNGTLDRFFNRTGLNIGFDNVVECIEVQDDGKIIVGGDFTSYNTTVESQTPNRLVRLNKDGSVDSRFNATYSPIVFSWSWGSGFNDTVYSVAVQKDRKIIVAGSFTTYNAASVTRLVRLNEDGSLDTSFNNNNGPNGNVRSIKVQEDGKILIGGDFVSFGGVSVGRLVRINIDGTLDDTFNVSPSSPVVYNAGFNNSVYTIKIQNDGKVLVGGTFTSYNGSFYNRLVRLESDGSLDTTFNMNIGSGFSGGGNIVRSIEMQDNNIVVAGGFTTFNGQSVSYGLTRLSSSGVLDTTFNADGTGVSGTVYSVIILPNKKIVIGGDFNTYNGVAVSRGVMRLDEDGYLETISGHIDVVVAEHMVGKANKHAAAHITFDNSTALNGSPEVNNVQLAIEQLDSRLDVIETGPVLSTDVIHTTTSPDTTVGAVIDNHEGRINTLESVAQTVLYYIKPVTSPYTITASDNTAILVFDSSSACTINIPDQGTLDLPEGFNFNFRNKHATPGQITISVAVGDTLSGAGSTTNDSKKLNSCYLEDKTISSPTSGSLWVTVGDMT